MLTKLWRGIGSAACALVVAGGCGATDTPIGAQTKEATPGDACPDPGSTLPAKDGCNTCTCDSSGRWVCTDMACNPADAAAECLPVFCPRDWSFSFETCSCTPVESGDGGAAVCEIGDTRPAPDGCNTCTCYEPGRWECTFVYCPPADGGSAVCSLPFDGGLCQAYQPVFAFVDGACVEQIYGGCGGNGNRFRTVEECMATCEGQPIPLGCPAGRIAKEVCLECLPADGCARSEFVCAGTCRDDSDCAALPAGPAGLYCGDGACQMDCRG